MKVLYNFGIITHQKQGFSMSKLTTIVDIDDLIKQIEDTKNELIYDEDYTPENFTYVSVSERTTLDNSQIDGGNLIKESAASHAP